MKAAIRIIGLLLLTCMLFAAVACGASGGENESETKKEEQSSSAVDATETEEDKYDEWGREKIPCPIDVENTDFNNTPIVIIHRVGDRDFFANDRNGEVVNDTIFERNAWAEEDLGVLLEEVEVNHDEVNGKVQTAHLSGTSEIDIVANYAYYGTTTAMAACYENLLTVPNLHLDQPYWNQNYNAVQNINNKQFFAIGSMNIFVIDRSLGVFFNKSMVKNMDLENPYQTVISGNWTLETLIDYTENSWQDLNNNDKMDSADYFGLGSSEGYGGWYLPCELTFVTTNENGYHELDLDVERASDAMDMLIRMFRKNNGAFVDAYGGSDEPVKMFVNDQIMFLVNNVFRNEQFNGMIRNMGSDYGLIPQPKFDDLQKKYHCWVQDAYSTMSIMSNCKNKEAVSATWTYLNYLSYVDLYPVYTEVIVKVKYLRDSESSMCFDYIVDGALFDIGEIYGYEIGEMAHAMCREIINTGNNNVAGKYQSNMSKWGLNLEKIDDFYFGE
ncbi:MAG: hypothetical protein IJT60_08575 [Clostridia bacterium]|nr:hypothetical protein [Clostridia bacterium]